MTSQVQTPMPSDGDARVRGALARTVACVLVVLVHVNLLTRGSIGAWWPAGIDGAALYGLPVPLFFMLSGYFASAMPGSTLRRLRRLLPPFLTWNAVLLCLAAEGSDLSPSMVVYFLLTGTFQLYYLFVLAQLLALDELVARTLAPRFHGVVVAIAFGLTFTAFAWSDILLRVRGSDPGTFEIHAVRLFVFWGAAYATGAALRRSPGLLVRVDRALPVLLATTVCAFLLYRAELVWEDQTFGFTSRLQLLVGGLPFQLLGSLLAFVLFRRVDRQVASGPIRSRLEGLAPYTFGVYLVHTSFVLLLFRLQKVTGIMTAYRIEVAIVAALVFALSVAFVRLVRSFAPRPLRVALLGEFE